MLKQIPSAALDGLEALTQELIDLNKYAYCGFDDTTTADTIYVFYSDKDGNWYIRRVLLTGGEATFASGTSGASAAFANPAGQSYGTYAETF